MPDVDPSNSYGTPEGPEINTPGVPTEPEADGAVLSEDEKPTGAAK